MYKLLKDDIWFKSHQALLLRILQSREGRDLLAIPQDFPAICNISKSGITGFTGYKEDKAVLLSRFYGGAKFGNIIRHRWAEFQKLSKRFYSHSHLGMTEIYKDGIIQLAATTSTFYPDPTPTTNTCDGYSEHNQAGQLWSTIRDGVGTGANDTLTSMQSPSIFAHSTTDQWTAIRRTAFLFDTATIGTDTVSSAKLSLRASLKLDASGWLPDIAVYSSNPASNTALVAGDYDSFGTTALSNVITYASFSTSAYNDFTLNASGLALVDGGGITKLGTRNKNYDVDDITPTWSTSAYFRFDTYSAENTGTSLDPYLEVIHEAATSPSRIGGTGVQFIDTGIIGGTDPHLIN